MDILTLIQQYINIKAVLAAVVGTQFVKFFLPTPPVVIETWWDRFEVRTGPFLTRIVPILPIVFGIVVTFYLERDSTYSTDDAFRGVMSGAFAAYSYRTTKALIFGE